MLGDGLEKVDVCKFSLRIRLGKKEFLARFPLGHDLRHCLVLLLAKQSRLSIQVALVDLSTRCISVP